MLQYIILHHLEMTTLYISIWNTRRSGCYAPILLAPAEGWGPFGPLGPCGPCWGPSAPTRVALSKLWTLNFEKLEIGVTLIAISHYIEAKFDYGYLIIFCVVVLRFYTKNFKSFWAKIKAWRWFSRLKMKSKFGKIAITPSFLVEMTWDFFCRILEPLRKKVIK